MKLVSWIGIVALLPATSGILDTSEAARKCRPPLSAPGIVVIINGKAFDMPDYPASKDTLLSKIDPAEIESISVSCSTERHAMFGVAPGRSLIVVFTHPSPSAALKKSLDSIRVLQEQYVAKHKKFATKLSELSWADTTGLVTVDLTVSSDRSRWSAVATHRWPDVTPAAVSGDKR